MLGAEIRTIRESRQLSLREVARRAGISAEALSALETGRRYPSLDTLERLASVLEITFVIGADETLIEQ